MYVFRVSDVVIARLAPLQNRMQFDYNLRNEHKTVFCSLGRLPCIPQCSFYVILSDTITVCLSDERKIAIAQYGHMEVFSAETITATPAANQKV